MIKLAFVFKTAPHSTAVSREGLDALLAATAFCDEDDIAVFFLDDGVLNLLAEQQPEAILQKDFIRTFKLLDLYEINQRYLCQQSLHNLGLSEVDLMIKGEKIDRTPLMKKLKTAVKILTF